jgi:hypothetical protein
VAVGIQALLAGARGITVAASDSNRQPTPAQNSGLQLVEGANPAGSRWLGFSFLAAAFIAVSVNGIWTAEFASHPEYTFIAAAQNLTRYIDQHPNGNRRLVSTSGDQITLVTHLPSICDDFGTQDLVSKLNTYKPGWFATWNDLDLGTLEDLHNHYSLEQVAIFHAFDHPDRNELVLFKLHPLPNGQVREPSTQNLQIALPGDKIDIPIE